MKTISQRELRNNSGEVLRAVAAGESILITNNAKPAALLTPVPESVRDGLLAAGRLVPAERRFNAEPRPARRVLPAGVDPAAAQEAAVDELLEHDRSDGR